MKILTEFLPILAFFIAFKAFDIYIATGVAIAITLLQMMWLLLKKQPITKMQIFNFIVILIFGGLTIFLHDESFIKIKPTILYWSFALALTISFYVFKKNLIQSVMGKELVLNTDNPESIWATINLSWIVYFVFLGGLNLYISNQFSQDVWVNFKLSTIGLLVVFIVLQGIWLSKYIKNTEEG
jgi:intracellular septation protein